MQNKYPTTSPLPIKTKFNPKMDFCKAILAINSGKIITKEEWGKGWSAYLHKKDAAVVIKNPEGKEKVWIISEGDILGKDYIEVK